MPIKIQLKLYQPREVTVKINSSSAVLLIAIYLLGLNQTDNRLHIAVTVDVNSLCSPDQWPLKASYEFCNLTSAKQKTIKYLFDYFL